MVDQLTLVLLAVAADTLVGLFAVSYLAGWWSVRKNERWLTSDRSAPYKKELGKAAVAELPGWVGGFDPAAFRTQLLADVRNDLAVVQGTLTIKLEDLAKKVPAELELPPWVAAFDPPKYAEDLRVSIVQTYRGMKGGRPTKDAELLEEAALMEQLGEDAEDYQLVKAAAGEDRAKQFVLGKRLLERVRARRGGAPASRGAPPARPDATPPPNGGSGQLRPEIVAALERAGFKREAPPPAEPSTSSQG